MGALMASFGQNRYIPLPRKGSEMRDRTNVGSRRTAPVMSVASACVLLWAGGCGDARTPLVIYSPHGRELLSEYERLYEGAHPEVDVRWFPMGAEVGIERVRSEKANPQADLWWGGPSTLFEEAERESLLAQYVPSWHEYAPAGSYSPAGYWYGTFETVKVIGYNSDRLTGKTAPQDWDDLLDAKWANQVIIRSPMESGTMKSVFAAMVCRFYEADGTPDRGYEWLRRLDANTKAYAASPATLMLMIARQEGLVTFWDLTDILLQRREQGVPMWFVVPRSGALVLTEGIAVVRGAPHPKLAEDFYEFVTTKEALLRQADRFFRVPTRLDITPEEKPEWLRSVTTRSLPIAWNVLGEHREEWMQYWDQHIKGQGRGSR